MKKILTIMISGTIICSSAQSLISCNNNKIINNEVKRNDFNLFLINNILEEINVHNKKTTGNVSDLNILNLKKSQYKYLNTDIIEINYDIFIKSNSNTFLNKKNRITEVIGEFDITLSSNLKNELKYKINYLPKDFNLDCNSQGSLIGNNDNAILYLIGEKMNNFIISNNPIEFLQKNKIINDKITLDDSKWKLITNQIYYSTNFVTIDSKHAGIIIIKNGNLDYTNINKNDYTNFTTTSKNNLLASYINTSSQNLNFYINKDILYELNDIYNSYINKEDYGLNNWKSENILIFNDNNYMNQKIFTNGIMNLFNNNYKFIQSLLKNDYNEFLISFDENYNFMNLLY